MTAGASKAEIFAGKALKSPHKLCLSLLSLLSLLLILKNPELAIANTSKALRLCALSVIPSLFPFMVISELIVSGGGGRVVGAIFAKPVGKIFKISPEGSTATVLGLLCGSPVGAKAASSLYKKGRITLFEYSRLLGFSNNPSSAFLISAVGASMFGSKSFGMTLYTISLISTVAVGRVMSRIRKKSPPSVEPPPRVSREKQGGSITVFTSAVTSSAISMLYICAFIVFFSTLVGTLDAIVSGMVIFEPIKPLLFGFFEMTGGVASASQLGESGKYIAAFIVGWSGLSVHFQIMSITASDNVPITPYLISKLLQGVLNVILLAGLELLR